MIKSRAMSAPRDAHAARPPLRRAAAEMCNRQARRGSMGTVFRSAVVVALAVASSLGSPPTLHAQVATPTSGSVEGRVTTAASGQPVGGVQVFVAGTTLGALTSPTGDYRIVGVPARQVELRTRLIGFAPGSRTVTVTAGQALRADFTLRPSALQLDQVVVTGTGGAVETKKLGNTIAIVTPPPNAPITTVSEVLQGREPGLVGLPSSGMTGEGARIRIRGNASISQSNEPIILVDGIRINQGGGFGNNISRNGGSPSRLDDIDPSSIARVEVLKGAAAATLYGTEASNGVIQIFTKKGAAGRPVWSFGVEQSASQYPKGRLPVNAGFATTQARADSLSVFYGRTIQPFEVIERRVMDELVETGYGQVYNGQVSGGTAASRYFVSGRYASENGPLVNTLQGFSLPAQDAARRAQATANIEFLPRSNLRLGARSSYTGAFQETPSNSNDIRGFVSQGYLAKPEAANCIRTVQLDPTKASSFGVRSPGECDGPGNPYGNGAFATIREGAQRRTRQDVQRFIGAFDAQLSLPSDLTLTAITGIDITAQRSSSQLPFGNAVDNQNAEAPNGQRQIDDLNDRQITVDGKARWTRRLRPQLGMTLDAGVQGFFARTLNSSATADNFPGPGLEVVSAGTFLQFPESFLSTVNGGVFGQVQFDVANWIFPTFGGRYDYASAFGEAAPGVFYPKASLSLVPSDREWYRSSRIASVVPTLRLRGAIGQSGRQPGAFDQFTTFGPIAVANPTAANGLVPLNLGNPDLAPEVSTEAEVGFEAGVLGDRIGLSATGWNRVVNDLLVPVQYAPSGGFLPTQLTNVGQMKARGVELQLNATALSRPNLQIELFANGAYLWQKITDLGGAAAIKVGAGGVRYRNFLREGYAPGSLFGGAIIGPCGQRPAGQSYTCLEGDQVPYDFNRDGRPDTRDEALAFLANVPRLGASAGVAALNPIQVDRTPDQQNDPLDNYLGKPVPDWSGGFGGTITVHRNWRLNTLFEYRAGNFTVTNLTTSFMNALGIAQNSRATATVDARLQNPATSAEQRLTDALTWANELKALSPYDGLNQNESGDFIRWRELALTYNAPAPLAGVLGASDLGVTFSVRNLALFTKYHGVDPEANQAGRGGNTGAGATVNQNFAEAIDVFGMPLQRRFTLAVRLGY
jgi:TonB-linked SusC/RagA family outer membrane protein